MTAPVADLTAVRTQREAAKAIHPASAVGRPSLDAHDRAELLVMLARTWEPMRAVLTGAHGHTPEQADELLLALPRQVAHPAALISLGGFHMPALREAVKRLDGIRAGTVSPQTLDCFGVDEAEADALADIDFELYPLLSGVPTRLACRGCRNALPVHEWRTQADCPLHRERAL